MISLRVESFKGRPLAETLQASFDESGGTIGRSESNALCLPDPERHISRIHAKVLCRDRQFSLADQGSNPVLLNGRPIGNGMTALIADGDVIAIGDYVIRVSSESAAKASAPATPRAAPVPPPAGSADPLGLFGGDSAPVGGAGAFDDLLAPAGASAAPAIPDPFADFGQAPVAPPQREPLPDAPRSSASGGGLFDQPGAKSNAAATGSGAAIPDDFDPFADPFAAPPERKPAADLPDNLGLSDLGIPKDNFGESADVDSLFALDKGAASADPLGGSLFGGAQSDTPAGTSQDPLVAFGGAAAAPAPPSEPDNIPAIRSAFNAPAANRIPDDGDLSPAPARAAAPPRPEVPPPVREPTPAARAPAPAARAAVPPPAPPHDAPKAVAEREAPPVQRPAAREVPTAAASSDALLAGLRRGLGVSDLPLEGPVTPELMERIGALLRESTQGTLDLLLARAMTKREVKAEMTMIVSKGNNPLKFSPNVGVALGHLFGPPRKGFMTPTQAMRDAYDDLRSHQFGFMAGMRAALEGVLKRFTPDVLERRLTHKSMIDSLLPMNRKAKLWALYTELYQEISSEAEDDFHALFGKEFLRAYEEQIARLDDARDRQA